VDVVSEEAVIAWLKVAETVVLTLTPATAFAGLVAVTVGTTGAEAVVKLHVSFAAKAVPDEPVATVAMVAVYRVA
jgi:hypothetical protein